MLKGSCLCRGIQYEIDATIEKVLQCHCKNCRKANGSAFATNTFIPSAAFTYLKGQELTKEFESSPGVFRVFCSQCASPLYSRRPSEPEAFRLRIGTLDTPIDVKSAMHIFVDSKAEWEDITGDIPQYGTWPH